MPGDPVIKMNQTQTRTQLSHAHSFIQESIIDSFCEVNVVCACDCDVQRETHFRNFVVTRTYFYMTWIVM